MTIDDKKKALVDAGKKVRSNASTDDIEMAYLELEAEQEAAATIEEVAAPAPEVEHEIAPEPVKKSKGKTASAEELDAVLRSADPTMGDKDPKVIAWCRENLSEADFEVRYSGRSFDR